MQTNQSVSLSTRVVQVCLFLAAAIAIFGGSLQMYLGEPTVSPRLDNVHRFMAGIYLSMGLICFWAAYTVRIQRTLVYLIALGIFIAALGRILSISIVGLPEPPELWIGYLTPEILLPIILIIAQSKRKEIQ